jgi:hypothetical protein
MEFATAEGSLAFAYLIGWLAIAAGVFEMTPERYRVARNCLWGCCLIFGALAVMWGVDSEASVWVRAPMVFLLGGIAALAAFESAVYLKKLQTPDSESAPSTQRAATTPTLEATRGATIDAQGAIIPGDLPFQFAKASDGAVISMPGVSITRKEDGAYLITPGGAGPVNKQFPPPKGEFSALSNAQLVAREKDIASSFREFQQRVSEALDKLPRDQDQRARDATFTAAYEPFVDEYKKQFEGIGLDLASEFLARLGTVENAPRTANLGGQMLLYGSFAGPTPASDIADFLDFLAEKMREKS